MTGDLASLRAGYLFPLAHLCHLGPAEVDELSLADFANYIDSIDAYVRASSERG